MLLSCREPLTLCCCALAPACTFSSSFCLSPLCVVFLCLYILVHVFVYYIYYESINSRLVKAI